MYNRRKLVSSSPYTLNISVTDGVYTSHCRVIIDLLNANNNSPTLPSNAKIVFTIQENSQVGTSLGILRAVDPDQGIYGNITYYMQSQIAEKYFTLHPKSGEYKKNIYFLKHKYFLSETTGIFLICFQPTVFISTIKIIEINH